MVVRIRWNLHAMGVDPRPTAWGWPTWIVLLSLAMNIFWFCWTVFRRPPMTIFVQGWQSL